MKSTDLISVFCRPVPFWSWNDKLEPDELRRQIGAMQDAGMGGFFMHARGGLETEYLSEDWFRAHIMPFTYSVFVIPVSSLFCSAR